MLRKALSIAACAVIGLLVVGASAGAAPYPPDTPSIGTSSSSITNAGSTTVMGAGWQPGSTVALTIASTPQSIGSASVQSDGTFSQNVTIPCLDPGTHTISGSGTSSSGTANTASTSVTVVGTCGANGGTPGGAPGSGTLPHTGGSDTSGVVTLASGLILLGAVVVIALSRRRSADL
jgi:LPXTG-motif cell wall-anchored protein